MSGTFEMSRKVKVTDSKKGQAKLLKDAAHMVEADHDEAAFEMRLKKIAKVKPAGKKKRA
jgi:hypothetical protein